MKCFSCGKETNDYLCSNCINEEALENIFGQLFMIKEENCDNPYILEYGKTLTEFKEIRNCIPEILNKFDSSVSDYYYCRYLKRTYNDNFEKYAINYLNSHDNYDFKKQTILYDLLKSYLRDDYEKPKFWCDIIVNDSNLSVELYDIASEYYSMVGDYDLGEKCIQYGKSKLDSKEYLFSNKEFMTKSFEKMESLLERYKNGKPYWPNTEERRQKIKKIYDEKGIDYHNNSISVGVHRNRDNRRVKEKDFIAKNEWFDDIPNEYISFFCRGISGIKVITLYDIGAVKIVDGKIVEEFYDIVNPWEEQKIRQAAAKNLHISVEELSQADSVDVAMKKFTNFIGDSLIISTEGLGLQKGILTRALRYAYYKELNNPIGDILDYAASKDSKFDFENNTRDFLLNYFELEDGENSLEKAKVNYKIVECLRNL